MELEKKEKEEKARKKREKKSAPPAPAAVVCDPKLMYQPEGPNGKDDKGEVLYVLCNFLFFHNILLLLNIGFSVG